MDLSSSGVKSITPTAATEGDGQGTEGPEEQRKKARRGGARVLTSHAKKEQMVQEKASKEVVLKALEDEEIATAMAI
eukprot:5269209-Karenia_brevis.AAC.1